MREIRLQRTNNSKEIIIIGAGGHGRVIADIITLVGDIVIGFLDDKEPEKLSEIPYLGTCKDILKYQKDAWFIVGIGDNHTRKEMMESYQVNWYTAIHPSAVIAHDVSIGAGSAVMANAVINTGSNIGKGVIINTAATIDHDCTISDYVHISPGAHLGGTVNIGPDTWIGIGAVVSNSIEICGKCIVGAGSLVIRNIYQNGIYIGSPAHIFKLGS
jgi:sugar O-acyltransferase (sialic acid O-acetyltransferase NeuD family)